MRKTPLLLTILLMFVFAPRAEGQSRVYKFVDEKGVSHFTNVPADPRYKPVSRWISHKPPKAHHMIKPTVHKSSKTPTKSKDR